MQKITTFLWFNDHAEAAAKFYTSIFKKSKITKTTRYPEGSKDVAGRAAGSVMTVEFQLDGQKFIALNGGPMFKFTEAISLVVNCKTQREIDYYWKKLTSGGGEESQCGWLKDKFGLSWQIVPTELLKIYGGKDPARSQRVFEAMIQMVKLDIKKLQRAAKGK